MLSEYFDWRSGQTLKHYRFLGHYGLQLKNKLPGEVGCAATDILYTAEVDLSDMWVVDKLVYDGGDE